MCTSTLPAHTVRSHRLEDVSRSSLCEDRWQSLPVGWPLSHLFALCGMGLGVAGVAVSWRAAIALLAASQLSVSGMDDMQRDAEIRALLNEVDVPYVEGCVYLDIDRDGRVGEDDVKRFLGQA